MTVGQLDMALRGDEDFFYNCKDRWSVVVQLDGKLHELTGVKFSGPPGKFKNSVVLKAKKEELT